MIEIREYHKVVNRVIDEVLKSIPYVRIFRGIVIRVLRREPKSRIIRILGNVARIITNSVFTDEERVKLTSMLAEHKAKSKKEAELLEGLKEKLDFFGITDEVGKPK